jgi:non-ribosomal peptide synthetase component E (peptide arylation enzyme)
MPEQSYAYGASAEALLGETIGANLRRTAARFGDREVLVDVPSGRRLTYRQFDDEVDALARALLGSGVAKGERIGIWAPNVPSGSWCSMRRPGSARSWSTSTPPTARTSCGTC